MSQSEPLITIFTAPKPFTDPHISLIQRNAIGSWQHLGDEVQVLLIGDEAGMHDFAVEAGILQLQDVSHNHLGTPLVSSIFELARQNTTSPLLAYVNADILLLPEFVSLAKRVFNQANKFLIVGQRWDLEFKQPLVFNQDWDVRLLFDVKTRGRLHPPGGSDYFVFPRQCFTDVPRFAIGRAGWDNWMFYHARSQDWPVIDLSMSLTVIHQDHDYSHLEGGQPHYKMPESFENIQLAGGRRTIFTLLDANYQLQAGKLQPIPARGKRFWRRFETYPLLHWNSYPLAELTFAICHPLKAFGEWRGRLAYKLNSFRHQKT
jgi:hypothetical protein